jgi:hypothetical protein
MRSKSLNIYPKTLKMCAKKFPKLLKYFQHILKMCPKYFEKCTKILEMWNIVNIVTY